MLHKPEGESPLMQHCIKIYFPETLTCYLDAVLAIRPWDVTLDKNY